MEELTRRIDSVENQFSQVKRPITITGGEIKDMTNYLNVNLILSDDQTKSLFYPKKDTFFTLETIVTEIPTLPDMDFSAKISADDQNISVNDGLENNDDAIKRTDYVDGMADDPSKTTNDLVQNAYISSEVLKIKCKTNSFSINDLQINSGRWTLNGIQIQTLDDLVGFLTKNTSM